MQLVGYFILTFVGLALLRIPIPFSAGLAGVICMASVGIPYSILPAKMFGNIDSFAYLAIPAFIYAGDVMSLGGITRALVAWIRALCGRAKGAVGSTAIIASALFGTISGSSVATVSAIGGMMLPEMVRSGYDKNMQLLLLPHPGFWEF